MSLFTRVLLTNAALVLVAGVLLVLTPARVSSATRIGEAAVLAVGVAVVLGAGYLLTRRAFADLDRLAAVMRRVDLQRPGERVVLSGATTTEVADLAGTFNAMLDRLEAERRESSRRAVAAQERERRRIALELHDEVGQTLTALMLQLKGAGDAATGDLRQRITAAQEVAREGVEAVRDIARGLRPDALEDFGLRNALVSLASALAERAHLRVRRELPDELPPLDPERELVVYRVAQEALTNVARHAGATVATLRVTVDDGLLELQVCDNGGGCRAAPEGSGIAGMRERALLAGGTLTVAPGAAGGTDVTLRVPR